MVILILHSKMNINSNMISYFHIDSIAKMLTAASYNTLQHEE